MKKFKFITAFLSLLIAMPALAQTAGEMRLSLIDGDTQVATAEVNEWVPASINMPVRGGDSLWVPEGGKVEVQTPEGTYVRFNEGAYVNILASEPGSSQFYMSQGSAYLNFSGRQGNVIQIDTPLSSIRVYQRAKFKVDVDESGYTTVSVISGLVDVESRDGRTSVNGGKAISIDSDGYASVSGLGPVDDWERWNRSRDRRLAKTAGARHLPQELQTYSSDLDNNGRWVHTPDYGYIWTPTVVVSVGWSPYRIGRWVWIGGDYVWISYEPWGWVPYHYGRWVFVVRIGWCWVPPVAGAVYWGPGFVGWVYTPTYVAWVPLAPGEIYYGHGYYGPYSVDIRTVRVTDVRGATYKNIHVSNSVTVVSRNSFVTGKQEKVSVKENPFLKQKINVGRPDIKPEKGTMMPVVKQIPQSKKPPAALKEVKVKELKQSRPFVKERKSPVIAPKVEKTMPFKEPGAKPLKPEKKALPGLEKKVMPQPEKKIQPMPEKPSPEKKPQPSIEKKFPQVPEKVQPMPEKKLPPSKGKEPAIKEVPKKPEYKITPSPYEKTPPPPVEKKKPQEIYKAPEPQKKPEKMQPAKEAPEMKSKQPAKPAEKPTVQPGKPQEEDDESPFKKKKQKE